MIYRYSEYSSQFFSKVWASPPPPDTQYCCSQVPGLFAEVFPEQTLQKTKYLPPWQDIRESKSTRIAAILNHSFFPNLQSVILSAVSGEKSCVFLTNKNPRKVFGCSVLIQIWLLLEIQWHMFWSGDLGDPKCKQQQLPCRHMNHWKIAHLKTQDMVSVVTFLSDHQNESVHSSTYIYHKSQIPCLATQQIVPWFWFLAHPSTCPPPQALSLLRLIPDGSLKERMLQSLNVHPTKAHATTEMNHQRCPKYFPSNLPRKAGMPVDLTLKSKNWLPSHITTTSSPSSLLSSSPSPPSSVGLRHTDARWRIET